MVVMRCALWNSVSTATTQFYGILNIIKSPGVEENIFIRVGYGQYYYENPSAALMQSHYHFY